jgi:hypothetical protein
VAAGRKKRQGLPQAAWDDLLKTPGAPTEAELWDLAIRSHSGSLFIETEQEGSSKLIRELHGLAHWLLSLTPASSRLLQLARWQHVWHGLDRLGDFKKACKWASEKLKGKPAEAGPDQMGAAYKQLQRTLPEEMIRPRTHERWRRNEDRPCGPLCRQIFLWYGIVDEERGRLLEGEILAEWLGVLEAQAANRARTDATRQRRETPRLNCARVQIGHANSRHR